MDKGSKMIKKLKFKSMFVAQDWVNSVRNDYRTYDFKSVVDKYKFTDLTQLVYDFPEQVMEVEIDSRGYGVSINGWSIGSGLGEFLIHDHEILHGMVEVFDDNPDAFYKELLELTDRYGMKPNYPWLEIFSKRS